MKRFKLLISILLIGLLPFSALGAESLVQLNGDRLTLGVTKQPLSTVLEKLSDQGIHIHIDPRINPEVTATFVNRPLAAAMSTILRSVNYSLVWRQDDVSGVNTPPRLLEIRIFYKGQEERVRKFKRRADYTIVKNADGTFYRKDVLLLQLASTMTDGDLAKLLDQLDATIVAVHSPLGLVQLQLPLDSDMQAILRTVAGYPGIRTAEPDYAYPLEGSSSISMDRETVVPSSVSIVPADGTAVAVMDSGLLTDYENSPFVQGSYDAVSPGAEMDDSLGHGTQMALIAAGVINPLGVVEDNDTTSPVLAIRAFDENGFTSNYTLIRGIDYAIQEEARVLNMSWGSEQTNSLLESAINYAAANGLILVGAAGNTPTGKPVYPAAYDNVIAVGALAPDGKRWDQSNYGDFVDIQAPGFAEIPVGNQGESDLYVGTSIAAAYISRQVGAILAQTPEDNQNTILKKLLTE